MITNIDLVEIAREHKIPLNEVFMKDRPPYTISNGGYIINLQDLEQERGGSHWTSLYVPFSNRKEIAYMDSFGFIPSQSTINWIKSTPYKNHKIFYNKKHIQNINSGGCGIYSLFFIDFMSKHNQSLPVEELLNKFAELFSNNPTENLQILKRYAPYYKNSDI